MWSNQALYDFNGVPVKYLCLDDLLNSKLAVSKEKDAEDIYFLQVKKNAIGSDPGSR